ncbi:MAG: lipocalin-like domain-containing protein [Muribaculaceae bacterium]|nr:lipocalin-like domain-containing protein [Muribaculaceae bacterium]
MKGRIYFQLLVAAVLACIATAACTRNNGNIGDWFGEWQLKSIEINGQDDTGYAGDVLWKFQNNIVEMVAVSTGGHTHISHFGTWMADDRTLTLDFTHSDDLNPAGSDKYSPPSQTMLPAGVTQLTIVKLSSSEIILKYDPASDSSIVYTLRKRG